MGGPCWIVGPSGQRTRGPPATDNFQVYPFESDGVRYYSCEQAYQALKFGPHSSNHDKVAAIAPRVGESDSAHGMRCWDAGQSGTPVENWDVVKVYVMLAVNRAKYTAHADLQAQLLATGTHDICGAASTGWTSRDGTSHNWGKWNGVIQMIIREELRPAGERREGVLAALLEQIERAFPVAGLTARSLAETSDASCAVFRA
jgi:predicted NAD-dependent protein-ADP-ribosyltransferase YbiA (DUF1768 family)